mmetsp:Transcript_42811/g.167287  ORF Transcript_42811/g.167287 Transcript_42811/m.167287 type:complete len:123 (+) Transcript_42811:1059-1427(+)
MKCNWWSSARQVRQVRKLQDEEVIFSFDAMMKNSPGSNAGGKIKERRPDRFRIQFHHSAHAPTSVLFLLPIPNISEDETHRFYDTSQRGRKRLRMDQSYSTQRDRSVLEHAPGKQRGSKSSY